MMNFSKHITIRNVIYFFSFIAGWPCVFYLMGWLPHYQINYIALLMICAFIALFKQDATVPTLIRNLIFIQIIGWTFYSLIHFDTSYLTRIVLLFITFFILKMQKYDDDHLNFCKIYNNWLGIQIACGTIGILLVLSGLLQPLFTFKEMDMRTGYYFGLFTTNAYLGGLVRNAGFFDEPGALSFWGIYALLLNKMFIKNSKIEFLLIVGLTSTLSVAYFIQLAVYLLVFYRSKSWKLILLIVVVFVTMKFIASYNEAMNTALFGRLQYDASTGTIAGDNRSVLMERCWRIFCDYPILGMGARTLASPEIGSFYGFVGANFFYNWAADGIVGGIITYLPLINIFALGKYNSKFYGIGIILLVGFLQRPYDSTQLLYPLMTYTILLQSFNLTFNTEEDE